MPPGVFEMNRNGAYSWFMDERAIVHRGYLVVGSVRSSRRGYRWGKNGEFGAVEVAVRDLASGQTRVAVLSEPFEQDDHNGPSLHVRPDGRVVAIYSRHALERKMFWRVSASEDLLEWGPERVLVTPGTDATFAGDNVTYSNPWQPEQKGGRMYNFFRCLGHQQNWMYSDDDGENWSYGGMFLEGRRGYAPYFKYAPSAGDTLFFIGTEDHPRSYDNSVYAGFVRGGGIYRSDGTL